MIKYLFVALAGLHGLIHLLGFIKSFGLARVEQLYKPIAKPWGILWLLATLLFLAGVIVFLLNKSYWWLVTLIAVLLSQILIFQHWQDARYGSIANVLLLLVCIIGYGNWHFDRMVQRELTAFQMEETPAAHLPEIAQKDLPDPVQKWLSYSQVEGGQEIAHLHQTGRMKLDNDGKWLPVAAQQWFRMDKPGFIWYADVGGTSLMRLSGMDKYQNGKGHMLIKLYSIWPVVNASGSQIDQGVAVRYLAETVWLPQAALSPYIKWEQTGPASATATLSYKEVTVEGEFTFNSKGQVIRFEAMRFYDKAKAMKPWIIHIDENSYKTFGGIIIPSKASVTWQLDSGDFTWYEVEINRAAYK
ncbi:DUF6544 family protein [Roseivirga sp. BDSF3-8]|uniref:DUF6544 family protein n=1 Tax=Roseivirga sp. BDSF3-8 TaxID=3241598 RepID=UPI0035325BD1